MFANSRKQNVFRSRFCRTSALAPRSILPTRWTSVPGDNVAKTVLLTVDDEFVLVVRPATDQSLSADEQIVPEGNSHNEAIYLRYHDGMRIEHPQVEYFSKHV